MAGFKVLEPAVLYDKVGQGGMGTVYRGRHFKLDLDVAVKCLKRSLAEDSPDFVARFEREARLAASIAHQNVVRVMDVHCSHGLHYIVMEFVRGESARERVLRKGKLTEQEALAIVLGAASGLAEAHSHGIVHRDIKPDNLLVSTEGRIKVADLGLAKAESAGQSLSAASSVMGTPQYMAPEQWESPNVGPAADVWALGATLYYLLCGEHAIQMTSVAAVARRALEDFPSLRDACPGLREEVYELFARCVATDPKDRFANGSALLKALRPLVTISEDALSDAASASNQARAAVVTPPPRETLVKIRQEVEADTRIDSSEANTLVSASNRDEVPETLVDGVDALEATPPVAASSGGWLKVVVVLALAVGGYGWTAGWFSESINMGDTADLFAAKQRYKKGMELLRQPGKLDAAIAELQQALQLSDQVPEAKKPLAQALDKRAERAEASDLDLAYRSSKRANDLLPEDRVIKPRFEALSAKMRQRLLAGFALQSTKTSSVESRAGLLSQVRLLAGINVLAVSSTFDLRGSVRSKGVRRLGLIVPQKQSISRNPMGTLRDVQIIDGEFSTAVTLPVGDSTIRFRLEDEQGVVAMQSVVVRVQGTVGNVLDKPTKVGGCPQYEIYNAAGCRMLPINVQPFVMGNSAETKLLGLNEKRHNVELTIPMWLAETEVTRAQWLRIMNTSPWLEEAGPASGKLPASYMTQQEAIAFCKRLTALERAAKRLPADHIYVLPTEAQWEFACRGGADTMYGKGITAANLSDYAFFGGTIINLGNKSPTLVGMRKANAYGLFDMQGNVSEWCRDMGIKDTVGLIQTSTYRDGVRDPFSVSGSQPIHRGGNFASLQRSLRCSARSSAELSFKSARIGFRPALARPR